MLIILYANTTTTTATMTLWTLPSVHDEGALFPTGRPLPPIIPPIAPPIIPTIGSPGSAAPFSRAIASAYARAIRSNPTSSSPPPTPAPDRGSEEEEGGGTRLSRHDGREGTSTPATSISSNFDIISSFIPTHTYIHVHTYIYIRAYIHICTRIHICTCIHTHTYTHIHTHTTHIHTSS